MLEHSLNLGSRLRLCASFVRPQIQLCDVGTDHAYLPIWLMQQHKITSALACDIRKGPLDCAKANIAQYHLEQYIATRMSDGLTAVHANEADDITVAGMGGDLIAHIVAEANWLRNPQKRLILQPMTKPSHLRRAMADNGFALLREEAVYDEHRVYTAMLYQYDPQHAALQPEKAYTGALSGKTDAEKEYLSRQSVYLQNRLNGFLHTGKAKEAEALHNALQIIQGLINSPKSGEQNDNR